MNGNMNSEEVTDQRHRAKEDSSKSSRSLSDVKMELK